ncbi:transposase [Pseudomonas sp. SIMBA_077]
MSVSLILPAFQPNNAAPSVLTIGYPKPSKAQVVRECLQTGATLSSVAISHGINANVIRKWLPLYETSRQQRFRLSFR